ncbi:hypothetical protein BH11PLA1_BH11PLA1_18390 [soil metagenome]
MAVPKNPQIESIFKRLSEAGIDRNYVRAWFLPDWWDDDILSTGSGRATFEIYLSRMTGLPIESLASNAPLSLTPRTPVKYKKRDGTDEASVAPAAVVAETIACGLAESIDLSYAFHGECSAAESRQIILGKKWTTVDLEALVDFAWDMGIAVCHMAALPKNSAKFDGIAMFANDRPVIVLGQGRDSPPWLAFTLAHEIAHVLLGHVKAGQPALADLPGGTPAAAKDVDPDAELKLKSRSHDATEAEADRFACELLSGHPEPAFAPIFGMTGDRLATQVTKIGPAAGIDPGVLALMYGFAAERIPVAQAALNKLNLVSGGHKILANGVCRHLKRDLAESHQMLVDMVIRC